MTKEEIYVYSNLENKRVLVVDDNQTNREIFSQYLNDVGIICKAVDNALDAEEALALDKAFDLLIMDYSMPVTDGLTLLQQIRQKQLSDAPAVFISSSATNFDDPLIKELNIAAQTMKPISSRRLYNLLQMVFSKSSATRKNIDIGQFTLPQLNILVAEDNRVNLMVIKGYLKQFGQKPTVALNGLEALALMQSKAFDLVLMDCEMPEMSGLEATIRFRETEKTGHLPIIALTAHALNEQKIQCHEAGMDDFISKPVSRTKLYEIIHKWVPSKV